MMLSYCSTNPLKLYYYLRTFHFPVVILLAVATLVEESGRKALDGDEYLCFI